MTHIYASIANAIRINKRFLANGDTTYQQLTDDIKKMRSLPKKKQNAVHMNFFLKKIARHTFKSKLRFAPNATLREEIAILTSWLAPDSWVRWETPLAHIIKRTPFATAAGDASLHGGGGFCLALRFWWHLSWPKRVKRQTKLFINDNSSGKLVSINILEYLVVIVNFCAALTIYHTEAPTADPHPVLLSLMDNTSAIRWTNHACKDSLAGRALGRFFLYIACQL